MGPFTAMAAGFGKIAPAGLQPLGSDYEPAEHLAIDVGGCQQEGRSPNLKSRRNHGRVGICPSCVLLLAGCARPLHAGIGEWAVRREFLGCDPSAGRDAPNK